MGTRTMSEKCLREGATLLTVIFPLLYQFHSKIMQRNFLPRGREIPESTYDLGQGTTVNLYSLTMNDYVRYSTPTRLRRKVIDWAERES